MSPALRILLLIVVVAAVAFIASLFRRLGLGELALIVAVLALAFGAEIVRYLVGQFVKGYRGNKGR